MDLPRRELIAPAAECGYSLTHLSSVIGRTKPTSASSSAGVRRAGCQISIVVTSRSTSVSTSAALARGIRGRQRRDYCRRSCRTRLSS